MGQKKPGAYTKRLMAQGRYNRLPIAGHILTHTNFRQFSDAIQPTSLWTGRGNWSSQRHRLTPYANPTHIVVVGIKPPTLRKTC